MAKHNRTRRGIAHKALITGRITQDEYSDVLLCRYDIQNGWLWVALDYGYKWHALRKLVPNDPALKLR